MNCHMRLKSVKGIAHIDSYVTLVSLISKSSRFVREVDGLRIIKKFYKET